MFWLRPRALAPLLQAGLDFEDFPPEPIPDDGTTSHAIERCFYEVARQTGFDCRNVAPLPYERCWPKALAPCVTVIVPVRNAQPWIQAALQSILGQDAPEAPLEIILVDNGSDDGSFEFMKRAEEVYPNVICASESKNGAGAARNRGLDIARGKYVTFLDADDLLTYDAISKLYATALIHGVDVVTSSLVTFSEHDYGRAIPFGSGTDSVVIERDKFLEHRHAWEGVFGDFGSCAKLYRTDFLRKNRIRFPEGCNFEDNAFVADVYMHADRIGIARVVTYLYRKYSSSAGGTQSTSTGLAALMDQVRVAEAILERHTLDRSDPFQRAYVTKLVAKIASEFNRFCNTDGAHDVVGASQRIRAAVRKFDLSHLFGRHWNTIERVR